MEHTKKMLLVDPRLMEFTKTSPVPDPMADSLRDLDHQMRTVLDRNDINVGDKANLYHQTLQRYLKRVDQYKDKPLGAVRISSEEKEGAVNTDKDEHEADNFIEKDVLQSVPKTMRTRAERLLHHLKTHPDITWNRRGEIEFQDQLVRGSNLTDLVNDVLRKRRNIEEPVGWKTFAAALQRLNVPQDLVGNPERWSYIRKSTKTPISITQTTAPVSERNVALSSLKKKQKSLETPISWRQKSTKRKSKRKMKKDLFRATWESL